MVVLGQKGTRLRHARPIARVAVAVAAVAIILIGGHRTHDVVDDIAENDGV